MNGPFSPIYLNEDASSVVDLAADPAVAATNIRRVRSLYSKNINLRRIQVEKAAAAPQDGEKRAKVAFGDEVGEGEEALLRPATAEINVMRQRFFHKCATRNEDHDSLCSKRPENSFKLSTRLQLF